MPIRVLSSPSGRGATNETVRLLVESLPSSVEVDGFRYGAALRGNYDVLHVHWPELLVRGRGIRRWAKRAAFFALVMTNRMRRIPMVWTVHNEHPHENSGRVEAALLRLWERSVSAKIYLYGAGAPAAADARVRVIPRGDYSPHYPARAAGARPAVNRVLQFGLVRRYKGVESLIAVVAGVDDADVLSAVVAGPASDRLYVSQLEALAAAVPAVRLSVGFVPSVEVPALFESSVLVVLPYRQIYNSGVALLALTLGRPVLVPASATMLSLAAEVGGDWVMTYSGELTAEVLLSSMARARAIADAAAPDLSARQWSEVGAAHTALYAELVADDE